MDVEPGQGEKGEGWSEKGENMMNSDHKGTNEKYRDNYDQIRWDIKQESKKGPVYGHFT